MDRTNPTEWIVDACFPALYRFYHTQHQLAFRVDTSLIGSMIFLDAAEIPLTRHYLLTFRLNSSLFIFFFAYLSLIFLIRAATRASCPRLFSLIDYDINTRLSFTMFWLQIPKPHLDFNLNFQYPHLCKCYVLNIFCSSNS